MEDGTGAFQIIGKNDSGKSFRVISEIPDGLIDDINERTLEELE